MFLKLFKYDFKYIFKMLLPAYIAYAGLGVAAVIMNIICASYGVSGEPISESKTWILVLNMTSAFNRLFDLGTSIVVFYTVIAVYVRFVRNMFKDEGYLTHTLPVSAHSLLLSKYAVSFVYMIVSGTIVNIFSFLVGLPEIIAQGNAFFDVLKEILEELFGSEVNVNAGHEIIIILMSLEIIIASSSVFFTCFSIGYSSNKKKMFKSILCMISFYFVLIMLFMFYTAIIIFVPFVNISGIDFFYVFYVPVVVVLGVIDVGGYFLSHYFITKKLNLE